MSTIGIIHSLGQAVLIVGDPALTRTAVEGLQGLLAYKLGYHIVSAVFRQLVQLVTPSRVKPTELPPSENEENSSLPAMVLDALLTSFEVKFDEFDSLDMYTNPRIQRGNSLRWSESRQAVAIILKKKKKVFSSARNTCQARPMGCSTFASAYFSPDKSRP